MKYMMIGIICLPVFLGFCSFLPAADAQKDKDKDKDNAVIKITVADNGKTIKAVTGKKMEIQLKGNPTTGFDWRMADLKSDVLKTDGKMTYIPDKNDPPRVGSGGIFVFKFVTAKPGKATVKMEYLRPWEKDKAPAEKFSVNIIVSDK
jgi:inhibitor of cysteine peptidase